jgi:hypothetical protein
VSGQFRVIVCFLIERDGHVLWKFSVSGQTTIALTDTAAGVTKTLVQVPTGSGPDSTFLAR